jgi:lysophospholipase L1-like esterase
MNPITRIIVLGDSVTWGQGLLPAHKFANLVAAGLGLPSLGNDAFVAHSGAIIGVHNPATTSARDGEIPVPAPMIIDQVSAVPAPLSADLVIITGGINDIGVDTIVNPLTDLGTLRAATKQACYDDLKTLLVKVLATFTLARVRVTGYFPILSPASNPLVGSAGDPLLHLLGNFNVGFPQTLERDDVLSAVSDRTMQFWQDSNDYMAQAVADANGGAANAAFVQMPFIADNALFAPMSMLWGFAPDLGPEDEVAVQRGQACDLQYPSPFELVADEICHHASVGHPNVAGAQAISRAILNTL